MSDQYELFEPIGRGHYGVLHRGHDLSLDRPVAVRIFDPRFVPDIKSRRKDLLNLSVSRPRSVAAHHLDRERAWLVMELLGGNLADEAAHGPITAERLRTVLAQTLEGLEALHSEGLLHAALKPTNLLRDAGGSIKLSDSRNLRYDDAPGGPTLAEMPLPSHAHGPLGKWTAPELLDPYFGAVGPALDFYNLGVLGFELLVGPRFDSMVLGRSAPTRDADLSWMRWHQSRGKSLPPALELAPRLPADLTAVLDRLVRKPVGERYASAAEALRDLNSRTVTGLPCSALPVEQPQSPSPEPLRRVEGPRRLFGGPVRGRKSLSRTVGARWFALALPPLVALVTMTAWMGNRPNPPTRSRTVVILSEPPGVEVTLDGARLPGRTPYRLPVSLGAHTVGLKLRGHQDTSERVDVPPGDGPLELGPFTLSKRISLARVRIKASPTPDRISLENVRTGVSRSFEEPAFQVTAGEYRIALERAGYRTFRDSFHLDAEARELDLGPFRLVRASRPVRIPCDPPGARIRIA
ncbi:MAG: PEGA domain-containing protein, partial [Isosphaeraceae bacterium]